MFESIRHWLEAIKEENRLFEHADDEVLHSALASLLYHIIEQEKRHDGRERHMFDRMMKQEFSLTQEQIDHLYEAASAASDDLRGDLHTINEHLKKKPAIRMTFMRKLLQLINIHGTHTEELDIFYETLHEVFPDLKLAGRH